MSATGAPTSKGFRAWVITFMVFVRQYVAVTTLDAIQLAASSPTLVSADWLTASPGTRDQSRIVFDLLVGCGARGLPADLLLSFPPVIVKGALGVAALAFISRQVLVVTDEGAAVLQAWFSQPPPVTKKWMLGPALVQWSRTLEQLESCQCGPSSVAKRLSLFHLVSKIPELVPEIAALRVAAGAPGIDVDKLVDLVRAKGEAFTSENQTQVAVANMCFAGVADEVEIDESKVACPFWKRGTCRWGARCKWHHEGPAGIATVAKRHSAREKKTNKKSGAHDLSTAADLKAMLLELLSGIATDLDCTVRSLLTKICGRWQSQRKVKESSLVSFSGFSRKSNNQSHDLIADGRTEKSVSLVSVSQVLEKPRASLVVSSDVKAKDLYRCLKQQQPTDAFVTLVFFVRNEGRRLFSQRGSSAERHWCAEQISGEHDAGCGARTHSSRSVQGSPNTISKTNN